MKLYELLPDITLNDATKNIDITHLSFDSRDVQKGSLFFAITGTQVDGSRFIAAAQKGGAVAIVHESDDCPTLSIPTIKVNNARSILANAASRFFGSPSQNFYLCGITGTNGKTTLTYLLEKFWEQKNTGVIGTVSFRYNNKEIPAQNTTPDAITIQKLFDNMAKDDVKNVAMEVSSHGLAQKRAYGCHYDTAIFTNLTQDHLDYHKDMEDYYQAKKLLFTQSLEHSLKKNKLAIINIDDAYGKRLANELKENNFQTQTFSLENTKANIYLSNINYTIEETTAKLFVNNKEYKLSTNLMGKHNLQNIMAALLAGKHSGLTVESMLDNLKNIYVPGRLERVKNTRCFVDYAHTPDALVNVINAIKTVLSQENNNSRLIVVFGCGGDRDAKKRPLMGEAVSQNADISIVTTDNPRTEEPDKIIEQILPGVTPNQDQYNGNKGYLVEVDRKKAIFKALDLATKTDVILVAGKGHEDYQIIGTTKTHFDDREVVEEWGQGNNT